MSSLEIIGTVAGVVLFGLWQWWRWTGAIDAARGKDQLYNPWDKNGNLKP